jgi:hypothetical protein
MESGICLTLLTVQANPITVSDDNTVFNAMAVLHHREIPQYNYYLEDANTPHGWNVLDCMDYTPPPAPYVPPAPPIAVTPAEKLTLVTTVVYFKTAEQAKKREGALGPVFDGEYFVVGRDEQAVKLSKDNKNDIGWVNTYDNKIEEKPAPTQPVDVVIPVSEPVDVSDNSLPEPLPSPAKLQYQLISLSNWKPLTP